ncbi:MAG: NAD-dependent epimerase/dehydratase family protein [Candidatus Hadarchaeales archaeon]
MKVLVTGGAGFIGSHLVEGLLSRGYEVVVLDDFSSGKISNLPVNIGEDKLRIIRGDVRNRLDVRRAMGGVFGVIHTAAIVSVPFSVENPEVSWDVNVEGTRNVLEEAAVEGVEKFVFISSCAVYGESPNLSIPESKPPSPLSPYAKTKLEGERLCINFSKGGLPVVILRYFNVYGPRQPPGEYAGVMVKFAEKIKAGEPPVIYGDGKQTRDFIFVSDVVRATLMAFDKMPKGEIINIGSGKAITINELCRIFLKLSGKENLKPIHAPPRPMDIRHSWADISKASELLGFKPEIEIEDGVRRFLREVCL